MKQQQIPALLLQFRRRQCLIDLNRCHIADFPAEGMGKSAVFRPELQNAVQERIPGCNETGVRERVDPEGGECDPDLRRTLGIFCPEALICAARKLRISEKIHACFNRAGCFGCMLIRRERLQSHGCDIRITEGPLQRPAAVRRLTIHQLRDQRCRRMRCGLHAVIDKMQRENPAHDAHFTGTLIEQLRADSRGSRFTGRHRQRHAFPCCCR